MALVRGMPIDGLCEVHAYEMAYGRGTPMRDTPMRWPLWEARLWDGLCEMHACEMAYGRGTPMRWPMRDARL